MVWFRGLVHWLDPDWVMQLLRPWPQLTEWSSWTAGCQEHLYLSDLPNNWSDNSLLHLWWGGSIVFILQALTCAPYSLKGVWITWQCVNWQSHAFCKKWKKRKRKRKEEKRKKKKERAYILWQFTKQGSQRPHLAGLCVAHLHLLSQWNNNFQKRKRKEWATLVPSLR